MYSIFFVVAVEIILPKWTVNQKSSGTYGLDELNDVIVSVRIVSSMAYE